MLGSQNWEDTPPSEAFVTIGNALTRGQAHPPRETPLLYLYSIGVPQW